jgi:hypothetical protein
MIEDFIITDAQGRVANVRMRMDNSLFSNLRGGYIHAPGNFYAEWHALTLGAFGAQSGLIRIVLGDFSDVIWRSFHIAFAAQLHRGVEQHLVILKHWLVNNRPQPNGTGTLMNGVNLGLQAGEITWSATVRRNH